MKKILLLLITLLFISGCSVNYNLKISDNSFYENTNIIENNSVGSNLINNNSDVTIKDYYNNIYNDKSPAFFNNIITDASEYKSDVKFYEKSLINNDNYFGITFNNVFNINDYKLSSIVNQCYEEMSVNKDSDIVTIKANGKAKCFLDYDSLNEIRVNIEADYKVIYTNADEVNNNVYTWVINKDNYKNKSISFIYSLKSNQEISDEASNTSSVSSQVTSSNISSSILENKKDNSWIIVLVGLISFFIVLVLIIKFKNK